MTTSSEARFLREAQLAASLDHPNVIPIFDAGDADGVLFLAMRYVRGSSLHQLLGARGVVSPEETTSYRRAGGRRSRCGSCGRPRPPRCEAGKHPARRARWPRLPVRLRPGEAHELVLDHPDGLLPRNRRLLRTGTDRGQAARRTSGRVLARGCRVPQPDGTAAVRPGKRVRRAPSASRGSSSACLGAPARAFRAHSVTSSPRRLRSRPDDRYPSAGAFTDALREALADGNDAGRATRAAPMPARR